MSAFEPGDQMDSCNVICPYCGDEYQADPCDGDGDEEPQERECSECGKSFTLWAEYEVTYHTKQKEPQ